MKIDIYAENPKIDLEYQIAVMQAAKEGKPVQCQSCPGPWAMTNTPGWNWSDYAYRIDPRVKPKPVLVKVPITIEDFIKSLDHAPTVWLRRKNGDIHYAVVGVSPFKLMLSDGRWNEPKEFQNSEYTFDFKTYHSFTKEVEA